MADENIRLVESAFDAWNRGEFQACADHMAEGVAWLEVSGRPEGLGTELVGRDRLRRSLETLFDAWQTYRLEVERIDEVGDRVVAVVREVARGRASGVEIDSRWGYAINVEEGQIVRIEAYRDPAAVLQAARVNESEIDA